MQTQFANAFLATSSSTSSMLSLLGHPQARVPSSCLGARKQSFAGRVSFDNKSKKAKSRGIVRARASVRGIVETNAVLDPMPAPSAEKNGVKKASNIVGKTPVATKPSASTVAATEGKKYVAKVNFIGPDRKGMMAGLSQLMFGSGCNILSSAQYVNEDGIFFQRMSIDYSNVYCGNDNRESLESSIKNMFGLFSWKITYTDDAHNVGILVSKLDHCLWDLLVRYKNNELRCEIPIIMSNHAELQYIADQFGIPFLHLPMLIADDGDKVAAKAKQEAQIETALAEYKVDTLILARYMQVMSDDFCAKHAEHTINIHHSFLPAFEGGRPYHRAKERGVKLIGATAHYATAKLDAGPIIVQDVQPISHRDSVKDMVRKGKDLERVVLAKALRYHLESRVMVHDNRTVVFE